jgi:hypothetical protein
MIKLKTVPYKGIDVDYFINPSGLFHCIALGSIGSGLSTDTIKEAEERVHKRIDNLLANTPTNIEQLAQAITDTLEWTGHEEYTVNPITLDILINNYLKAKQ